ncbi:hypothetical protein PSI23_02110 [Xenorhabdus sp. XENO-10]|uniref:MFS transporter n=1 Tax=Xenorhabdus yunnanensis TaxID=3025878 RepID=A0ABT5LCA6_9GAMM|nr:hypothetical protein [Xenorhabdus yunnanensis]MDC9588136.1 hypothetical protein [Xenorhabdus yunnanensis]
MSFYKNINSNKQAGVRNWFGLLVLMLPVLLVTVDNTILGFTVVSVLTALSASPEQLIIGRAALGFFGAMLMPSTLALISCLF